VLVCNDGPQEWEKSNIVYTKNGFSFFVTVLMTGLFLLHEALSLLAHSHSGRLVTLIVPGPPPLVRLTGTLEPTATKSGTGLRTLGLFTDEENWQLALHDVKTLTYTTDPDWMILNDIIPRKLHVVGPDSLVSALLDAERRRTLVSVTGRLYIASRMFLVTSVESAE
jgi:hypothetical protein